MKNPTRTTSPAVLALAAIICTASTGAFGESKAHVPLKDAVAAFNRKAEKFLLDYQTQPSIYTKDQFPKTSLTEDEIVAAILGWDRKKHKVDDKTYSIFQKIADMRALSPEADFSFNFQWYQFPDDDDHEFLVWWIDLNVMTSTTTGYTFRIREDRLDRRRVFQPSPGYTWIVKPRDVTPRQGTTMHAAGNGVTLETRSDGKGALSVIAAWLQQEDTHGARLVAFDEKGNRYILDRHTSVGSGKLTMRRFYLDPAVLPADNVKHLGFEAVSSAKLKRVSELAVRRAKEKGIEMLPWPEIGRRYEFTLTTTEGQIIDSRKLLGKVLLIDCWASWCGPCVMKLPKLQEIYDRWHGKGLDVLCLSFDMNEEASKAVFKSHKIPWPMVFVPSDKEVRQLWTEAVRVPPIPRILVIDRQGVLHSDISSFPRNAQGLEEIITALLEGSSVTTDNAPKKSQHNNELQRSRK